MKAGRILISLMAVALLFALGQACVCADAQPRPKSIILMIGDGMGISQIRSAAIYAKQVLGRDLAMDSILTRGLATTASADSEVTDSAAAATALYSGHKANSRAINFSPEGNELSGIGHAAKKAGLSVGALTTTRLTHATPAALYSRSKDRDKENFIATQLPDLAPEVALGGGRRHFLPRGNSKSARNDDNNIIQEMRGMGYGYVNDRSALLAVRRTKPEKLLGLFASSNMAFELDRLNDEKLSFQPALAEMTDVALSILGRNPKGFFVMIEGGLIDYACHANDLKASIYETLAFDDAVKIALEYQRTHPDVLVIVTADHETGGLGLGAGLEYALNVKSLEPIKHSTGYLHSRIKAQDDKALELIGGAGFDLSENELKFLKRRPFMGKASSDPDLQRYGPAIDRYFLSWTHYALGRIESGRAKVGWTSFAHTAQPVLAMAVGPGEENFRGVFDNTDIAKRMARLLGLTLDEGRSGVGH